MTKRVFVRRVDCLWALTIKIHSDKMNVAQKKITLLVEVVTFCEHFVLIFHKLELIKLDRYLVYMHFLLVFKLHNYYEWFQVHGKVAWNKRSFSVRVLIVPFIWTILSGWSVCYTGPLNWTLLPRKLKYTEDSNRSRMVF